MRHSIIVLVLAGCASTPSHPASPPPPQGEREHGMRNCPSALAGAMTRANNTAVGVDLEVTATDPAIRHQIVQLARMHGGMGEPDGSAMEHTGLHGGPGAIGYCPIVHAATNVTYTPLDNGAMIHIRAVTPEGVNALQTTVADRVARLATR